MSEILSSPESKGLALKKDLLRLFSPEFADVHERSERTIFFGAKDIDRTWDIRSVPEEALSAADEGLEPSQGWRKVHFNRYQTSIRLFSIEKFRKDNVSMRIVDYGFSSGVEGWPYSCDVDLLQPTIAYNEERHERLANVVRAILEHSTDAI